MPTSRGRALRAELMARWDAIGGDAIVDARSKHEAIEHADRVVGVHAAAGVAKAEIEIRPLFDDAAAS